MTIEQKIKSRLDDYLQFDSNKLFNSCDLIRIFGGAIRDSICGDPINDIDIIIGSKSIHKLESFLICNRWTYREDLLPKDLSSIYSDIHVITEPHTWVKNDKFIQLIRPAGSFTHGVATDPTGDLYKNMFNNLIKNVDISSCGVSWDGKELFEDYKGSIIHCQNKVFYVNKRASMYSTKRIIHRIDKFEKRGWEQIEQNVSLDRDLK